MRSVFFWEADGDDRFVVVARPDLHGQFDNNRFDLLTVWRHTVYLEVPPTVVAALSSGKVCHVDNVPKAPGFVLRDTFALAGLIVPCHAIRPNSTGDRDGNLEASFLSRFAHIDEITVLDRVGPGVDVAVVRWVLKDIHGESPIGKTKPGDTPIPIGKRVPGRVE